MTLLFCVVYSLIDPKGLIRHATINDLPIGRSVDEAFTCLAWLASLPINTEVCPANWQPGSKTMKADPQRIQRIFPIFLSNKVRQGNVFDCYVIVICNIKECFIILKLSFILSSILSFNSSFIWLLWSTCCRRRWAFFSFHPCHLLLPHKWAHLSPWNQQERPLWSQPGPKCRNQQLIIKAISLENALFLPFDLQDAGR